MEWMEVPYFDEQKRYIDFSAAMGYESVLVDALWDTQIGRDKIAELAQYGKGKNVALFLWYNSNGYWNDAPQSPRGIMDNPDCPEERDGLDEKHRNPGYKSRLLWWR